MFPQWFINHWLRLRSGASLSPRKAAALARLRGSEGGRRRGVPIGIDNPNFSVINRSPVHVTWCTKSLRASDVIGIYWPENWDALSPPELHVPSFLIFLPAPPVSAKPPFYIHSLPPFLPSSRLDFSFSRGAPCCPSIQIHLSLPRRSVSVQSIGVSAKCSFNHGYITRKSKESVAI